MLITSPGVEVGCKGLHSVTSAKPRLYKLKTVRLTPLGEPISSTLIRSCLGRGDLGGAEEAERVELALASGRKSSVMGLP